MLTVNQLSWYHENVLEEVILPKVLPVCGSFMYKQDTSCNQNTVAFQSEAADINITDKLRTRPHYLLCWAQNCV